jgi:hypothetical protein
VFLVIWAMHTRDPLHSAVFGPEELSTLYRAFDAAWEVVRRGYSASNPVSADVGRLRLADAVLAAHQSGLVDAELITAHVVDRLRFR